MLLCPFMIAAVLLVMLIGKKWHVQPILTNFKPQIALASAAVLMAHLVLTAIATAVSARLGQVMTIVICCGVFLGGLLSNHFLGKRAIDNQFLARIVTAQPELFGQTDFVNNGDTYKLTFELEPRERLRENSPFYYGPNPSGAGMANLGNGPDATELAELSPEERLSSRKLTPGVILISSIGKEATIRRIGADEPATRRPPQKADYVFARPTRINPVARAAWGIIPNIQFFWLVDAVSQNQRIPAAHVGLVALYGLMQIGVFLCLGVILFQKREVG